MKKYKGWEIAKLISEGKLEGRTIQKVTNSHGIACKELNMFFNVSSEMVFHKGGNEGGSSFLTNGKVEYILPQEPVTFMDCVNSDRLIRVEHEISDRLMGKGVYWIDVVMHRISTLSSTDMRKVILEGKWYLEEAEDGEM